jgi:hypothetical protein
MSKLMRESPLLVMPSLAVSIGLNEAIVLQQLLWLTNADEPPEGWLRGGMKRWRAMFRWWSEDTIARAFTHLRELALIEHDAPAVGLAHRWRLTPAAFAMQHADPDAGEGEPAANSNHPQNAVGSDHPQNADGTPCKLRMVPPADCGGCVIQGTSELFQNSSETAEPAAAADCSPEQPEEDGAKPPLGDGQAVRPTKEVQKPSQAILMIALGWCEAITAELVKNPDQRARLAIPPDKRRTPRVMANGVRYAIVRGGVPPTAFTAMQGWALGVPFWRQKLADMPSWVSGARFCELYNAWAVATRGTRSAAAPPREHRPVDPAALRGDER